MGFWIGGTGAVGGWGSVLKPGWLLMSLGAGDEPWQQQGAAQTVEHTLHCSSRAATRPLGHITITLRRRRRRLGACATRRLPATSSLALHFAVLGPRHSVPHG